MQTPPVHRYVLFIDKGGFNLPPEWNVPIVEMT
jgi:hypothetical protein